MKTLSRTTIACTVGLAVIGTILPLSYSLQERARAATTTSSIASSTQSNSLIEVGATVPNFMVVNQDVKLRGTPGYGKNIVADERPGQLLWVIGGGTYSWWHVRDQSGNVGFVVRNKVYASPPNVVGSVSDRMDWNQTTTQLPPDATWDTTITPLVSPNASWEKKLAAVMFVAQSKLGTPYRLWHNEDRGQSGFDCSNFAAYVYHHALGLKISGSSQVQYKSVGWTVPVWSMRPGDLIIFENGAHVGIYVGNNEMIEEGGGLGKVGYLSVAPGSTWGSRITTVKRLF